MNASSNMLAGQVAVVTGGSSGIGAATARLLASAGARVVISYHRGRERARALADGLPGAGHQIVPLALPDSASAAAFGASIIDQFGRVDMLVNSAGFTKLVPHDDLDALDDAVFDEILVTNARGPFSVIRALLPALRQSPQAAIVNVSSISAFTGSGSNIAYCASKAALDTTTLSLARVLGPSIRVFSVSPGAVATDFVAGRGREDLERIAKGTPLTRVVEPEDVARAIFACITFLTASTGCRVIVDGGRSLV